MSMSVPLSGNNQADHKGPLTAAGYKGDLVVPGDEEYEVSINRFATNARRRAALVAFVRSPEDVSLVIKYATSQKLPLVVRGGGHSTAGSSSTEGGIVIDLSRHVNHVRVDAEKKLAYVGGGADWAAVDPATMKHGLATVAGTINHTGVGGLTLGGGYGWLTGKHNLTIDNVEQATIVTASGDILTASANSHEDLFWAIRGGGPNFGAVTEFVYRLHPQRPTVYAGPVIFPYTRLEEVIGVMENWYANCSEDEGAIVGTASKGQSGGPEVVAVVFFNGEEAEGRKRFKSLFDLVPVMDLTHEVPYEALNGLGNGSVAYGRNYHIQGINRQSLPPAAASSILQKAIELANAPANDMKNALVAINWDYHNVRKMATVPSDATAFCMRRPNPIAAAFITWEGESEEASQEAKERLRELKAYCEDALESNWKRTIDDVGYTNYEAGNPSTTDWARIMFGSNYHRLQEIKKKYDPNMVFKSWYPIVPTA